MASSMMASERPHKPHPYLEEPLLYLTNLPSHVSDAELAQAFSFCLPFKPLIHRDDTTGWASGTVQFKELEPAERALATLNGRPIPFLSTTVYLSLSPFPPTEPAAILPQPGAVPRLVKHLPDGYNDAMLYELFRRFGPLAAVRTPGTFEKNTGIVEFWIEEDAKLAEAALHCAEIEGNTIVVQVFRPTELMATAPAFIPNFPVQPEHLYSASAGHPSPPYARGTPGQRMHSPPLHSPGSSSTGLIDPCNLFIKNLDPSIDSNALFSHFRRFGQIISARVMRDDDGQSRGFGFVSYQTPQEAANAMHSMNGLQLGSKQLIVRLHEPKQFRQQKLAARFGAQGDRRRSASGATSPSVSERGDSSFTATSEAFGAFGSNTAAGMHARRSSGSYYNAALTGQPGIMFTLDDLSVLSPVVRTEILKGELQRRLKDLPDFPLEESDAVVDVLLGLPLTDMVGMIQDPLLFSERVQDIRQYMANPQVLINEPPENPALSVPSGLLDIRPIPASAPECPSTPVSASQCRPPRTSSSPGNSVNPPTPGTSERERIRAAVERLEPTQAVDITELLMTLSKRERAMCLFNVEVLRAKVADAKAVLESDDGDDTVSIPVAEPPTHEVPVAQTTVEGVTSALESLPLPSKSSEGLHSIAELASMKAIRIVQLAESSSTVLLKADPQVTKDTDQFIDSLAGETTTTQKQKVGEKLFKVLKSLGLKGAPKLTTTLLDTEDLRALAHLMNSYPAVLKEKALTLNITSASKW